MQRLLLEECALLLQILDAIGVAVIGVVQLLNTASAPACSCLRVLKGCFSLGGTWIEVWILRVNPVPVIAVEYSIIIGRWIIVAQGL